MKANQLRLHRNISAHLQNFRLRRSSWSKSFLLPDPAQPAAGLEGKDWQPRWPSDHILREHRGWGPGSPTSEGSFPEAAPAPFSRTTRGPSRNEKGSLQE